MSEIDDMLVTLLQGDQKDKKTPKKVQNAVVSVLRRLLRGGFGAFCLIIITLFCAYFVRKYLAQYRVYSTSMDIMLVNEKDGSQNSNVSAEIIGGITGWSTKTNKHDEIKIMSSRPVILRMIRDTHILDTAYVKDLPKLSLAPTHADSMQVVDTKVNEFKKAIRFSMEEITTKGSSSLITLSINGYQGRSKMILNGIIKAYNSHSRDYRKMCYTQTLNFLGYCIDSVRNELNKLDLFEQNFSEENFIVNLSQQSGVYLDVDRTNEDEVRDLNLQRQLLSIIRGYMIEMGQDYKIVPANTGINDEQINKIVLQFNELVMRRSNFMTSMGEDAMRVQTINNQLEDQRNAIIVSISKLSEALEIRLAKYEQNLQESSDRLMTLPRKQLVMAYIEREREIIIPLYRQLQQKYTETLIAQSGEQDQARIISQPYVEESLLFDKGKKFYMMALAIAILLAFVFMWKIELPEPNLELEDILAKSELPVWGVIPTAPREVYQDDEWRKQFRKRSVSAHNFDTALQSLLTRIDMSGAKTIVVTSGYSSDGKTFLIHQLATLMLDKKIKFEVFDWKSESNLQQLIQDRKIENRASNERHYTLIDAGSYHENPELPILSREADITLYCIRAENSDLEALDFSNYVSEEQLIFNGAIVVAQANINLRYAVNFGTFDYEVPSGLGVIISKIKR